MPRPSVRATLVVAASSLALLNGCANLDDVLEGNLETFEFDCENDRDVRVAFMDDGDEVRVFSGEDSTDLRLTDTKRGGDVRIYEGDKGRVRMVDQGDRLDITIRDKDDFENCRPEDRDYRGGGGAF